MSTVKLSTPIMAHGAEITELELREPLTKDIIELGLPTLLIVGDNGVTGVDIRQPVCAKYISRLAGIPLSSVEKLSPKDFSLASAEVLGFFGAGDIELTPS
jgi:hypothetical protein